MQQIIFVQECKAEELNLELFNNELRTIEVGDLFRSIFKSKSDLAKEINDYISIGKLVPDRITQHIINNEINKHDSNIIIDNYPRTVEQLELLIREYPKEQTTTLSLYFLDLAFKENMLMNRYDKNKQSFKLRNISFKEFNKRVSDEKNKIRILIQAAEQHGINIQFFIPKNIFRFQQ